MNDSIQNLLLLKMNKGGDIMNCFHELVLTLHIQEDIPAKCIQEALSRLISTAMLRDERLKLLHEQNCFKMYSYCSPTPLEPDRIYHKGRIYVTHFRTPDTSFACAMKTYLPQVNSSLKVVAVDLRQYTQQPIFELKTLTPIICTTDNRCWLPQDGIGLLSERLHNNAVKKLKLLDSDFTEPTELFFSHIELLNEKPIVVPYKKTTLLGHKINIVANPDEVSQKLAFTLLAAGALEKNGLGFGYVINNRRR